MAGLIKEQMMDGAAGAMGQAPAQRPAPTMQQAMPRGNENEQDEQEMPDPETDPGYQQAVQFAMQALYENQAAKQIAKSMRMQQDPVEALANTAYEIISIVDERTDGAVPDELLAPFAAFVLEEVSEIGEAAGLQIKPADVALALKQMILRFLGEQGVDTTQLQQAMDQVDPEEFNQAVEQEEVPA